MEITASKEHFIRYRFFFIAEIEWNGAGSHKEITSNRWFHTY